MTLNMRRLGLAAVILGVLVIGAGGAAYYVRSRDPLSTGRTLQQKGDLKGAALALRNAVRSHPESAEAHWRLGTTLLGLGDPIAAEKELEAARDRGFDAHALVLPLAQSYLEQQRFADLLRDFPPGRAAPDQLPLLLVDRALAEVALKNPAAAQATIDEAEQRAPQSPEVAFAAARVAAARNDLTTARREVDRSLAINPHNAPGQMMKAELLNLRGDRAGSIAALDQAIAEQPHMQSARIARANQLMIVGQDAKARADVDAVLADAPKDPIATYLLGVLLVRAHDYAGADQALQKISTVITRIPRGTFFEAVAKFNLGQTEQALDAATRYAARNPTDLAGAKLLAQIDMATQRPDRAVEALTRAASAGAADAETLDLLGRAYAASGQQGQAVQSFERAASLAPRNTDILTRLASARFGSGDISGAASDYSRSLEMAPAQGASETGERAVMAALAAGDLDRARAALGRLRDLKASPTLTDVLDGTIKMSALDLPAAQAAFASALGSDPKSIPARLGLATIAQMQGNVDQTERLLREALVIEPANETALSRLLGVLLATNRVPQALEVAQTALKAQPGNTTLATLLSDLSIRAGTPQVGAVALDAIPSDRANLPAVQAARARLQVALGKPDDAKRIYRQILDANPTNLPLRIEFVNLLTSTGDMDGGRAVIRDGLAAMPGDRSLLNADVLLAGKVGGVDAALAEADALARDRANAPAAAELRGNVLRTAGRFDEAAAAYTAAFKAAPSSTLVIDTAEALGAAGHKDQAIKAMQDWVAANPGDTTVLASLAGTEIAAKQFNDAATHLAAVLAKRPDDPGALNNLAWVYQQQGDPRALATSRKAYLISSTPQASDTLGWILTRQGKAAEAVPLLRQALAAQGTDPMIAYHYAVALKESGQTDEAVRILKLLAAAPAFEDKPDATKLLADLTAAK